MRINIYVSDELHSRMESVGEDANWSEVAQRAFEQKLGEIAANKTKKTMSDVIDRLRASKAKAESKTALLGKSAAKKWCENRAQYEQLERVANLRECFGSDFDRISWNEAGLAIEITRAANGENDANFREVGAFFESFCGEEDPYTKVEFCTGFLAEVERFFEEVQKQL